MCIIKNKKKILGIKSPKNMNWIEHEEITKWNITTVTEGMKQYHNIIISIQRLNYAKYSHTKVHVLCCHFKKKSSWFLSFSHSSSRLFVSILSSSLKHWSGLHEWGIKSCKFYFSQEKKKYFYFFGNCTIISNLDAA